MKKINILIVILFFSSGKNIIANSWTPKANVPFAIVAPACFTIGNFGYIVGGSGINNYTNSTFQYDPANDIWTQKADAGTILRFGAIGFSLNGKGFIGMGMDNANNVLKDLLQYDPVANTWTSKANIPQERFAATVLISGSKVFVTCGLSNDFTLAVLNDLWEYNATSNTWTSRAAFPGGARYTACSFTCNGNCYLFGGADSSSINLFSDLWYYNPVANSWTQASDLPAVARGAATSFSIGNYGYLGTGLDFNTSYSDFWRYDPANDLWLITDSLGSTGRDWPFSFVINNIGYVGGGEDDFANPLDDFWQFTPDSNIYVQEVKAITATVNIGPDPVISNATFTIHASQPLSDPHIRFYNTSGETVMNIRAQVPTTVIDFSSLKPGIYFYGLNSGNRIIKTGKFLKIGSDN